MKSKFKYIVIGLIIVIVVGLIERRALQIAYIRVFKVSTTLMQTNDKAQLNGPYVDYIDGKVNAEANFIDGVRDGWNIQNFENGSCDYKTYYKNGKLEGNGFAFYKDGSIKTRFNFKNNLHYGSEFHYSPDSDKYTYVASDIKGSILFYSIFDYSNRLRAHSLHSHSISKDLYSYSSQLDSDIVLKDGGHFSNIQDLNVVVATPPTFSTKVDVNINQKHFNAPINNNTITIKNAFPQNGSYEIFMTGALLNSKNEALVRDTVSMKIVKD